MTSRPRWKVGTLKPLGCKKEGKPRWKKGILQFSTDREVEEFRLYMNFTRPSPSWYQPHMPWYDPNWRIQESEARASGSTSPSNRKKDMKELNALLEQAITHRNRMMSEAENPLRRLMQVSISLHQ